MYQWGTISKIPIRYMQTDLSLLGLMKKFPLLLVQFLCSIIKLISFYLRMCDFIVIIIRLYSFYNSCTFLICFLYTFFGSVFSPSANNDHSLYHCLLCFNTPISNTCFLINIYQPSLAQLWTFHFTGVCALCWYHIFHITTIFKMQKIDFLHSIVFNILFIVFRICAQA